MKRILLIIPYGTVGGMEKLAQTFYYFYKEQGHSVKVVKVVKNASDSINFADDEYFLSSRDLAEYSGFSRLWFYFRIPFRLAGIIKKEKITHTISFGDVGNLFSSLTFTREFKIGSIHSLKSMELSSPTFLNRIFRLSYRTSYRFLDKVVCIGETVKKDLIENCGFRFIDKMEVIYNPHPVSQIISRSESEMEIPADLSLFDKDVVLFVGRMAIPKAPWHLVKSFVRLLESRPETRLVFIGDGLTEVTDVLNELVDHYGIGDKVFFLGHRNNPYPYVKRARILVLSSYFEGMPNVIVEAMALKVPVVSSRCTDGIAELMMPVGNLSDSVIDTRAGLIMPSFYKGKLEIDRSRELIPEESTFAEGLAHVLANHSEYVERLTNQSDELLSRFDHAVAAGRYLAPLNRN